MTLKVSIPSCYEGLFKTYYRSIFEHFSTHNQTKSLNESLNSSQYINQRWEKVFWDRANHQFFHDGHFITCKVKGMQKKLCEHIFKDGRRVFRTEELEIMFYGSSKPFSQDNLKALIRDLNNKLKSNGLPKVLKYGKEEVERVC